MAVQISVTRTGTYLERRRAEPKSPSFTFPLWVRKTFCIEKEEYRCPGHPSIRRRSPEQLSKPADAGDKGRHTDSWVPEKTKEIARPPLKRAAHSSAWGFRMHALKSNMQMSGSIGYDQREPVLGAQWLGQVLTTS